ncbi:negative elongation factor A, putative [Plasmodium berghei]|uniref:Negative elongation factor A, putative n=2 Tax=Plasmodium berghei TaxID=5821 RepID=A0A509ARQ5_PLABA|nr:negative elongation factor A, putative [Plasmodium berghei ANKA]CXJ16019.1 negative elongation factor A, putative [Plasmodium berghei]SCM26289.1 negative elongation factor A, putative [Plasmodium berghei]SCN28376.1 negative elongation factor A, putative [Plasmodium berghei]SCO62572.1 negative elongation factor A, putative [Plasmodium berghei]SCO64129.1 negative elongation factor A, putative [Plasmodium berghei]|eukprot:XP_034424026.1 negative elongation factor A, putative [Plasmodium berghei ANKA]
MMESDIHNSMENDQKANKEICEDEEEQGKDINYNNDSMENKEDTKSRKSKNSLIINKDEINEISDKYIKYLECIKNNWSSSQASKLLNEKLIKYISERFLYMSSSLKVRVLTSFFYLTDKLRIETKEYLLLITANGEIDGNGWVKKFSRILKQFVKTGIIDIKDIDSQTMHRILNYIDQENSNKKGKKCYNHNKKEIEYIHMCDPINELKNLGNKNIIHLDEYKMFTPSKNFDCLLLSVIKKGINEFKN